jgi:serine/threonine protein phosphatase PrpC
MPNRITYFGNSDVGLRRPNNEDAFVVRPDLGLCVVADGMGGAAAGEVASRIFVETAVEVFSNHYGRSDDETTDLIRKTFGLANERVLGHVASNPDHKGMGCTAELVGFSDGGFVLGHMGDSRTYRFRNNELKQISSDHSFVQEQIDRGIMTPAEARKHPMRNIILRAVGVKEDLALDIIRGRTYPGDQFLLCSDGLTDMVDDAIIGEVVSTKRTPPEKVEQLIALAKSSGGKDNITIVLVQIE